MGASSVEKLGLSENGAEVLAKVSTYYLGYYGSFFLGLMITVACLTTSVGLITACASFFHELFPNTSYKKIAVILSIFSTLVANIGLTQLIKVSTPVLMTMYLIAISLIFLTFLHPLFKGRREVYQGSLILTFVVSLFDGLNAAKVQIKVIHHLFTEFLPMYDIGLGWLIPSLLGGIGGYIFSILSKETSRPSETQFNK
jgi:LIVCS family branched-chain amino acid:cation transporter